VFSSIHTNIEDSVVRTLQPNDHLVEFGAMHRDYLYFCESFKYTEVEKKTGRVHYFTAKLNQMYAGTKKTRVSRGKSANV
jgi:hypothetical protein